MAPLKPAEAARITLILLVSYGCLCFPAFSRENRAEPWRVLVVHSYDPGYAWTRKLDIGLRVALSDLDVAYRKVYLDAKRNLHPAKIAWAGRQALEALEAFQPHLVVAADDAAQAYFVVPYLKGRADLPVIFCGVNADIAVYGYPAVNVTGVSERFHFAESFLLAKSILPKATTVAYLSDASETGAFLLRDLTSERNRSTFALRLVSARSVDTFQEWKQCVLEHQNDADFLALGPYQALRDESTGTVVPDDAVVAWTASHNAKPVISFVDFALGHDSLCGVLERAEEQGYLAGRLAREVLQEGRPVAELPVSVNQEGVVMINLRAAERLGIVVPYEIIETAGVLVQ